MTRPERPRGATGLALDNDKLTDAINAAEPEYDQLADGPLLLVETSEGIAVLCTEGVGWTEKDGKVGILARNNQPMSFRSDTVPIDVAIVKACATEVTVDIADFIRKFGDRLETNHSIWYRRITGRSAFQRVVK